MQCADGHHSCEMQLVKRVCECNQILYFLCHHLTDRRDEHEAVIEILRTFYQCPSCLGLKEDKMHMVKIDNIEPRKDPIASRLSSDQGSYQPCLRCQKEFERKYGAREIRKVDSMPQTFRPSYLEIKWQNPETVYLKV